MIYFDNAATNGFHPSAVTEAAATAVNYLTAHPGSRGHRLSVAGAEIVYNARKEVARFFGVQYPERVLFTKNSTPPGAANSIPYCAPSSSSPKREKSGWTSSPQGITRRLRLQNCCARIPAWL